MGFWQRNWEKITTDTLSGVSGRSVVAALVGALVGGGVAYLCMKFIVPPVGSGTTKELIIFPIVMMISIFLMSMLSDILTSLNQRRKDKIKEQKLKNEKKYENMKLKLKLLREKQKSSPDEKE